MRRHRLSWDLNDEDQAMPEHGQSLFPTWQRPHGRVGNEGEEVVVGVGRAGGGMRRVFLQPQVEIVVSSNHWRVLSKGVAWSGLYFYQVTLTVLELDYGVARVEAGGYCLPSRRWCWLRDGGSGSGEKCTDSRYMSKGMPVGLTEGLGVRDKERK